MAKKTDDFAKRLRTAMGRESAYAFAKRSGLDQSLLSRYLAGKVRPRRKTMRILADTAGVRLQWLMRGGDLPAWDDEDVPPNFVPAGFGERLAEVIAVYGTSKIAAAADVSEGMVRRWQSGEAKPWLTAVMGIARTTDVNMLWLMTGRSAVKFPPQRPKRRLFALLDNVLRRPLGLTLEQTTAAEALDDAMTPCLQIGDRVLLRYTEKYKGPGVYALIERSDDEFETPLWVYLRRLEALPGGRLRVSADNPAFPSFEEEQDAVDILGKALFKLSKMT